MKKSYTAVVIDGKIFLNEATDLPEGTTIQLIESTSFYQSLVEQIEEEEKTAKQIYEEERNVEQGEIPKETPQPIISESKFDQFDFEISITKAIEKVGYVSPTIIQNQAIKPILERRDVLGIAKTGSGKTAAFSLPILNNLLQEKINYSKLPTVLIITPTRELALQIGVSFDTYGRYTNLNQVTIFGGVSQKPQVERLKNGRCAILVATPGRLLDLIGQGFISLNHISTLILDEADRMLDMGFIPDIKKIVRLISKDRQSLMFSATMPTKILDLAKTFLKDDFIHVTADKEAIPIDKIKQEIYFVEREDKLELLHGLLANNNISRGLIFSRTKYGADKLVRKLKKMSFSIEAMHGNKSQQARQRVLKNFKENEINLLVATDLAARGLDVDDITHVINYDLPAEPETYMHRIGRTARAGKSGIAISFCQNDQRKYFPQIEQLLGFHIPRAEDNPFQSPFEEPPATQLGGRRNTGKNKYKTSSKNNKRRAKKKGKRDFKRKDRRN